MIAVDVGGAAVHLIPADPAASSGRDHRHPTGADRSPAGTRETILPVATGLVDAVRADGANPRAAGVAARAHPDRAT